MAESVNADEKSKALNLAIARTGKNRIDQLQSAGDQTRRPF